MSGIIAAPWCPQFIYSINHDAGSSSSIDGIIYRPNPTVLITRAAAHCSLYHFILTHKIICMQSCMQCRGQLRHEVTKKAIKAALKLCMHVIYFIWVTFKNMSLKWFSKLSWSSPALSPSSNTPDSTRQFISRDFKTWSGSEKGTESWEKIRCVSDPRHVKQLQLLKK